MALLLVACGGSPEQPADGEDHSTTQAFTPTPVPDGRWLVLTIDGKPVEAGEFFIETSGGTIRGGYDGCNSWSKSPNEGTAGVISTLQGCGKSERMQVYDTIALGDATQLALSDQTLMARSGDYRLSARLLAADEQLEPRIADYPNLYSSSEERAVPPSPPAE